MRRPLRHAVSVLQDAGYRIECIRQDGRHTVICVEGGNYVRLHRGGRMSRAFERELRSAIRNGARRDFAGAGNSPSVRARRTHDLAVECAACRLGCRPRATTFASRRT